MEYETKPQPETARAAIDALGLAMTAEFVPYSLSRNARSFPKLTDLSLNWKVTIHHNGRAVLTTDYGAGVAHAPSYQRKPFNSPMSVDEFDDIRRECESGRSYGGKPIMPSVVDVVASLASDADALDHPDFDSWAADMGYDTDSRQAEKTYRACLETGLKLRAALGDDGLRQLREAFHDY